MLDQIPRLSEEEASSFSDDLADVRAEFNDNTLRDPWGS